MPLNLEKVDYEIDSANALVSLALGMKKEYARTEMGFASQSCWASISYIMPGGSTPQNAVGCSQLHQDIDPTLNLYKNDYFKCHGELSAVNQCIQHLNGSGFLSGELPITAMYIEMSPCPKCYPSLENLLLTDRVVIYYSFDYGTETSLWSSEAKKLCKA